MTARQLLTNAHVVRNANRVAVGLGNKEAWADISASFWNTAAAQRAAGGSDGEFGATGLARGHNRRAVEAAGFNEVILDSSFCPKTPSSVMPPRT